MTVVQPMWLKAEDVPELPSGWRALPTAEATEQLKPGKLYDQSNVQEFGSVPVLNQADTGFHGYHDEKAGVVASADTPIITFANHTCAMRLMRHPFSCIQNIFPKVGKAGVCDTVYFYYAARGRVNLSDYKGHHPLFRQALIPIPPLPAQKKIAAVLSAYDDLIENNERRIRILEDMAQNLYREWFVKFRFPGHKQVKLVDSPLGKIPQGWEVNPLSAVCCKITDGSHSSPKSVDFGGYPMASVKDMMPWGFDYKSCRSVSEEDFRLLVKNHCRPSVNDVLIAKDGSYLKHVFVVEEDRDIVLLSSIAILRPDVTRLLPYVLCMTLRQPETKTRLSGYVSGAALPRIILKDFAGFLVACPPSKLQEGYWEFVGPMMKTLHVLLKKNTLLRQTRDLLLPKLISGEVDVSELDIRVPEDANAA